MKEARCETMNGGIVPTNTYVAGPVFGAFKRTDQDTPINAFETNVTATNMLQRRRKPLRDPRRFVMLVDDKSGEQMFKACSPTCVKVDWDIVPFKKRISGFGRKTKGQDKLPINFIPPDLGAAVQHTLLQRVANCSHSHNVSGHNDTCLSSAFHKLLRHHHTHRRPIDGFGIPVAVLTFPPTSKNNDTLEYIAWSNLKGQFADFTNCTRTPDGSEECASVIGIRADLMRCLLRFTWGSVLRHGAEAALMLLARPMSLVYAMALMIAATVWMVVAFCAFTFMVLQVNCLHPWRHLRAFLQDPPVTVHAFD